eukprot:33061-Eustigmatos_ZCMA.PRE.1
MKMIITSRMQQPRATAVDTSVRHAIKTNLASRKYPLSSSMKYVLLSLGCSLAWASSRSCESQYYNEV